MHKKSLTPRRARRPGRPGRAGIDQRARLLDGAVALFARQGVAATSLQAIACEADVTPALVHYYFGSRDQLLDVLVNERLLPLVSNVFRQVAGGGSDEPVALVRALVPALMHTVTDHPWLPPIWVREVLSDGGSLRERVLRHARQYAPVVHERFAAAQRAGRLNPGLDPRLLLVSLIGLTLFPFAAMPIWRNLFDAGDITTDTMIGHVLALLERGLEASHASP